MTIVLGGSRGAGSGEVERETVGCVQRVQRTMASGELSDPLMVVGQILNGFDVPGRSLSESLRGAIRVARLTRDYASLWWLTMETVDYDDKGALDMLEAELASQFDEETYNALGKRIHDEFVARRGVTTFDGRAGAKDKMEGHSVAAMEQYVADLQRAIADTNPPQAERVRMGFRESQTRQVLERIRTRVYTYLTQIEQRLVFEERNLDVFDEHIEVVNDMLDEFAPDVQPMFTAAYERLEDPKPENLHQAGTTCRRILKAVADHLYPPRAPIMDATTGKERLLGEEQFVNRLLAFAEEHLPATMGEN
jgi:hypothetical protein